MATRKKTTAIITTSAASEMIDWVSLAKITTDNRVNTRDVDLGWVDQKKREGFDPTAIGVPIVSKREDGTYIWLDGQHRGELMRQSGWGTQKIQCRIFSGLTLQEEALQFLKHNDSRRVQAIHKFFARVTAEDPVATAIVDIVEGRDWKISDQNRDGLFTAVGALEEIFLMDATDGFLGGNTLDITLSVVNGAWGHTKHAASGNINKGIALVINRSEQAGDNNHAIDYPALINKLAKYGGGPSGLLGAARTLRPMIGGSIADAVAQIVIQTYNTGRRKHALPRWR